MSEKKSERYSQGMQTRRSVLGSAHVDRAEAAKTPFDAPFQELITEAAWGHVWSRDTITKRERSMITLALLAGLGNFEELALHTRATANTGASRDDVMEAMLHVAIYAGVPRANHAIKVIKQVFEEMDGSSAT
jgi:4-carboxymuconolactone decarboxylase